ncbi:hypothetical protein HDU76_006244 [Blyttiomyces sp. JEL0837]|nr:hypothetical protein HDU76_006244 [Blyttiomyces sp. JEL0837]
MLLNTRITKWDWIGTLLIVSGGIVVSIFGTTDGDDRRNVDELLRLFLRPTFLTYFTIQIVIVALLFALATWIIALSSTNLRPLSQQHVDGNGNTYTSPNWELHERVSVSESVAGDHNTNHNNNNIGIISKTENSALSAAVNAAQRSSQAVLASAAGVVKAVSESLSSPNVATSITTATTPTSSSWLPSSVSTATLIPSGNVDGVGPAGITTQSGLIGKTGTGKSSSENMPLMPATGNASGISTDSVRFDPEIDSPISKSTVVRASEDGIHPVDGYQHRLGLRNKVSSVKTLEVSESVASVPSSPGATTNGRDPRPYRHPKIEIITNEIGGGGGGDLIKSPLTSTPITSASSVTSKTSLMRGMRRESEVDVVCGGESGVTVRQREMNEKLKAGMIYAAVGGIASSETLLLAKSGIEMIIVSVVENRNQFRGFFPILILALLVTTVVLQLFCLNQGIVWTALENASPLVAIPLFYTLFTVLSLSNTVIYFDQLKDFSATKLTLICLGIGVIVSGVWILSASGGASAGPPSNDGPTNKQRESSMNLPRDGNGSGHERLENRDVFGSGGGSLDLPLGGNGTGRIVDRRVNAGRGVLQTGGGGGKMIQQESRTLLEFDNDDGGH